MTSYDKLDFNSVTKKRKRLSLVCVNCKKKKIKCDREQPCSQCIKATIKDSCIYESTSSQQVTKNGAPLPYVSSAKTPIAFSSANAMKNGRQSKKRDSEDEVTVSLTELNMLKDRLQKIESSIGVTKVPAPVPANYVYSKQPNNPIANISPTPFNSYVSPVSKEPSRENAPIQLPPINFSRQSQGSLNSDSSFKSVNDMPTTTFSMISGSSETNSLYRINPYDGPEETINFYEGYTSIHVKEPLRRINFGPFAWSSLMKKDYGLRLLWDYMIKKKEEKANNTALVFAQTTHEITQENTNVVTSIHDNPETAFQKRALETDGYGDMIPYNSILKARVERNLKKSKLNENALPLGLTFYDGQIVRELQLIDKIQVVLPQKKVIWKLIKRYFTWLYPFMPFLDEAFFITEISKIIGPESFDDVKITEIKVEKRLDLAHLGILLIVLRLAYLSLFCNKSSINEENLKTTDPSPQAQEMKYLLSNPININIIDVAQLCLDQFQLLRKTNLSILQLAFYMRLYHTYAPEDGDGADGGDSQVLNAVLIQMAYSLGLNREPDNFDDVCNDPKVNHLGRKIWHFLVFSDLYHGYAFGNPMTIHRMYYDTKVPFYQEGSENISDVVLDKYVTQSYFNCYAVFHILTKLLSLVLNVEGRTKMSELCKLLSELEVVMQEQFGTLEDCLKPLEVNCHSYIFTRNFKTKCYLSLKAFYISIYYHIFLHYETKNINLSFFYLKKSMLFGASDVMPHYFDLLGNSAIICDMIINPTLESVIHKSNQLNLACIIRVNFTIHHMKSQGDHDRKCINDSKYCTYYKALCRLSSCLTRCAEVSIAAISKLSNRYYYAWRITKGHTFLLKTITSKEFYVDNYLNARHVYMPQYSLEQLEELINICETTLSKLGKSESITSEFCRCLADDQIISSNRSETSVDSSSFSIPTPQTEKSTDKNSSCDFGLEFVDNAEIDRLWFQMLSMKHDNKIYDPIAGVPNSSEAAWNTAPDTNSKFSYFADGKMQQNNLISNIGTPFVGQSSGDDIDRFGFDLDEVSHFDIFSDLPLDQVFNN